MRLTTGTSGRTSALPAIIFQCAGIGDKESGDFRQQSPINLLAEVSTGTREAIVCSVRFSFVPSLLMIATAALVGCAPIAPILQSTHPTDSRVVLFVCEHGVAKSALAAALFNDMAKARGLTLRAERRAASTPQIEPSLSTNKGMAADGLPMPEGVPLQISERDVRNALRVVTLGTSLPVADTETITEDWADVPAVGDGYPAARDSIRSHVSGLLDNLTAHPIGF